MKRASLRLAALAARLLPIRVKQAIYRKPRLARFIRRGLNQAAPEGLTQVKVAAGGLAGASLFLDLQIEKDYWLGTYEPELQAAIQRLVQPGIVAYDVGANIGYITLLLVRAVGVQGRVYAFEPLPANLERLQRNLELNHLGMLVEVLPVAVVEANRQVEFLVGPSGGMGKADFSAGRQEVDYNQTIQVHGITLDDFSAQPGRLPPAVIKMDIEGGEVLALSGMRRLLAEIRPLVFLELHGPQAAQAAWQAFEQAGYQLRQMTSDYPIINSLAELDWKAYLVALPSEAQHL